MGKRNNFGTIEKLNSGKFRARYKHPFTGERISAPTTYTLKTDASLWLKEQELAIQKGTWRDTRVLKDTVNSYGLTSIEHRALKQDTREEYLAVWNLHISPFIGSLRIQDLTPDKVRTWFNNRISTGAGRSTVSYAYRILKSVCAEAVREQVITYQPCQVVGASQVKTERRTPLTIEQVVNLANAVAPRYKALVLFLALTGLRIGEATALTIEDLVLDSDYPSVKVSRRVKAKRGGGFSFDTPKTKAGLRTVQLPSNLLPILQEHIHEYTSSEPSAYLFATKLGNPAITSGAKELAKGLARIGLAHSTAHDLRHTSATLAIELGVPAEHLRERLGHSSLQSTAIYTHSTPQADKVIADKLSGAFKEYAGNVVPIKARRAS